MDTLTHSLVGVALSRVFFKKRMACATTAAVIAANLPDLDVVYSWPGIRYIEYHRGILHSVWMLPVWSLLVAWGLRGFARRRRQRPPAWGLGLLLGFVCVASHLLLDWTNAYGIRLLAPASEHWYALDWLPILDPWIWLLLIGFLAFPMLLGLTANEVGSRRTQHPHRLSAALALILLVGWVGVRARQHGAALAALRAPQPEVVLPGRPTAMAAIPQAATPFDWRGLIATPASLLAADVRTPWNLTQARTQPLRRYDRPPRTPALERAAGTRTGRIFLWYARFPWFSQRQEGRRTLVDIADLRYGGEGGRLPLPHVEVVLDPALRVLGQSFSW